MRNDPKRSVKTGNHTSAASTYSAYRDRCVYRCLAALEAFLAHLPAGLQAEVVIVQHKDF
jgi:hypothetical protein